MKPEAYRFNRKKIAEIFISKFFSDFSSEKQLKQSFKPISEHISYVGIDLFSSVMVQLTLVFSDYC